MEAAAAEFAQHGYRGTRVQSIVDRAGVNERMIYHHFGSKRGLYDAVVVDQREAILRQWRGPVEKALEQGPYEGVRTVFEVFYDVLASGSSAVPVALTLHEAMSGAQTELPPDVDGLRAGLRELYERGQREGVFRADHPFEVAYTTAAGAFLAMGALRPRVALEVLGADEEQARARLRDLVVRQLLDGLTPRTSEGNDA